LVIVEAVVDIHDSSLSSCVFHTLVVIYYSSNASVSIDGADTKNIAIERVHLIYLNKTNADLVLGTYRPSNQASGLGL